MYGKIMILGILVSILFTELTGLSAGLILPAYFVLCLVSPWRIVYTLLVALAAAGLMRLIARRVVLFGRRRLAMVLFLSFLIDLLAQKTGLLPGTFRLIGIVVPGILAREFDRQGVPMTLLALTATTAALALILMLTGYPVFGR